VTYAFTYDVPIDAEVYQLLVRQRGWSPQRYERFLADTWRRLLLPG